MTDYKDKIQMLAEIASVPGRSITESVKIAVFEAFSTFLAISPAREIKPLPILTSYPFPALILIFSILFSFTSHSPVIFTPPAF